jgi:hypothetical protein
MIDRTTRTVARARSALRLVSRAAVAIGIATVLLAPASAVAGISLVRMQGVIGTPDAPGSVGQVTLAIGTKSIPFNVISAQKISGEPAMAPEILSALGPGPPPIRVEGSDGTTKKLVDAPAGSQVTITGNLNFGTPLLTLMQVEVAESAGAK